MADNNEIAVTYSLKDEVSKPLSDIKSSILETAAGFAAGALSVAGLQWAFNELKGAVIDCMKKFDEAALAAVKLETAMGNNADTLKKYAEERAKVTRFDDEATKNAMATLAMYGLTEQQILKLIPALQNMAQATGKDLGAAAELAGRSITTSTNALKRQGVELGATGSATERLTQVVDQLNNRFHDQAEAAGRVGLGPLVILRNQYDELKENIGKAATEYGPFKWAVDLANKALERAIEVTDEAKSTYESMTDWETEATSETLWLTKALLEQEEAARRLAPAMISLMDATPGHFGMTPEQVKEQVDSFKTVTAAADETRVEMKKELEEIDKAIKEHTKKRISQN